MTTYRAGDIVLTSFPFAGGGQKSRPALVVHDSGDADVVLARVTSQPYSDTSDVEIADWRAAGLLIESVVRVHKVATLEKRLILRKLGSLTALDLANVRGAFERTYAW